MRTVFVTGAASGIGAEFTRQYLASGKTVFAGMRDAEDRSLTDELSTEFPDRFVPVDLDVTDPEDRRRARDRIESESEQLDLLINVAGVNAYTMDESTPQAHREFSKLDESAMVEMCRVNAFGPLMLTQKLYDLIEPAEPGIIANVSSSSGSLTRKSRAGNYSYSGSKAALNMLMRDLALDVGDDAVVVLLDPGWVQTRIGGPNAEIPPEEAVTGLRNVLEEITLEQSGSFIDWEGRRVPW